MKNLLLNRGRSAIQVMRDRRGLGLHGSKLKLRSKLARGDKRWQKKKGGNKAVGEAITPKKSSL